ncbi:DUF1146 domain-containing protein [Bacillus sp. RO3]|nr:DUF1146 domain-containing protein [Bacillus sp. RO3]
MIESFGQQALISMLVHLFVFGVTFWSLQSIQLDKLLKKNRVAQGRLLYILLTVAIGSSVSRFLLDYYLWSQALPVFFE